MSSRIALILLPCLVASGGVFWLVCKCNIVRVLACCVVWPALYNKLCGKATPETYKCTETSKAQDSHVCIWHPQPHSLFTVMAGANTKVLCRHCQQAIKMCWTDKHIVMKQKCLMDKKQDSSLLTQVLLRGTSQAAPGTRCHRQGQSSTFASSCSPQQLLSSPEHQFTEMS